MTEDIWDVDLRKTKHVNIEVSFLGPLSIARKECRENGIFRVSCAEGERVKRVCAFLVIQSQGDLFCGEGWD